jgi:hypothetical protein
MYFVWTVFEVQKTQKTYFWCVICDFIWYAGVFLFTSELHTKYNYFLNQKPKHNEKEGKKPAKSPQ